MSSILTNASALTALQSLNMTQQNLAITQSQISTGLKVKDAADNASYWSIAQSLQSDNGVLSAVNSSIAQSQSIIGAATAALNNVITTIGAIKTVLGEAANPGADITTLNATLTSLGSQLTTAVTGASYSGLNLLDNSQTATLSFVAGYNVSSNGVASFNNISLTPQNLTGTGTTTTTTTLADINNATTIGQITALATTTNTLAYGDDVVTNTAGSAPSAGPPFVATTTPGTVSVESLSLSGVTTTTTYTALDANGNETSLAGAAALTVNVQTTAPAGMFTQGAFTLTGLSLSAGGANSAAMMTAVNTALTAITSYSSSLGSTSDALTNAMNFNNSLSTNYTTGIGALVDADMNQASTRLQALQTQQQLGVQSLSIANQSSQLILKLFQ
ncbi:MAG: flagellin [Roseiarcus sp.]|jgi:flagellin